MRIEKKLLGVGDLKGERGEEEKDKTQLKQIVVEK